MSWFQRLYETYENCVEAADSDDFDICPLAHTSKNINIEIKLKDNGDFEDARVINEKTIIPTTDNNGTCMWCLAVDIKNYQNKYYKKSLSQWADVANNEQLKVVNKYILSDSLIDDLVKKQILWLDNNNKLKDKKANPNYDIFSKGGVKKQEDAFIRWVVGDDTKTRHTWKNKNLIDSWIEFRKNELREGFCYVKGEEKLKIAEKQPYAVGNLKLIVSEDKKNFIFNGRFKEPIEALSLSFDASQKAHKTLHWLINPERKQAYKNENQIIVAFNIHGQGGDIGEIFGENFVKAIRGYNVDINPDENIVILEVDSATGKGRAAITYYRELLGSQYLANVNDWHKKYNWEQYLKIKTKDDKEQYKYFEGTPAIDTIATAYLYKKEKYNIDKSERKIKKKLIRDLMPSVLEGKNIPKYIEEQFIRKASNPIALNYEQWQTILRIACAIYKGNKYGEVYKMFVDETNKDRNYLYGRLLAVVDYGERLVLWANAKVDSDGKKDYKSIRQTNAQRFMKPFSGRPADTWQFLYEKFVSAYQGRLKSNWIEKLTMDIVNLNPHALIDNSPLNPEYLLGYFCQLKNLQDASKNNSKKNKEKKNDNIK